MQPIKKLCKLLLDPFGLEVRKKTGTGRLSLEGVLKQLKHAHIHPHTVVDVGAAYGEWTKACSKIFPDASYLLIEPLHEYDISLQKVTGHLAHADVFEGLAGSVSGERTLYVHPDLVGSSMKREREPHNQEQCTERRVQTEPLQTLCERLFLPPPYLIKLDVQGAELDVLEGAQRLLPNTVAFVLEVSLINVFEQGQELAEIVRFMNERGFVVYDLFGLNYRPYDGALSQVDLVFVAENNPARSIRWYASPAQRAELNQRFAKQHRQHGL